MTAALAMARPGEGLLPPAMRLVGLVPIVAGISLHRAGARRFREAGTTIEPHGTPSTLVEEGVFAWSRNPMYAAGALILLGLAVLLGSAASLVVVPVYLVWVGRWFIRDEEGALSERFGTAYLSYRTRVRRWI